MMQKFKSFLLVSSIRIATAIFTFGQGTAAGIVGTVTDPNGAVIPNATVVARNIETNARRTVTSNGEGFYSIP